MTLVDMFFVAPERAAGVWARVLEVMRQPIEDKVVTISRAQGSLTFPSNF
jgi:predicted ATPase with chaperone activity